MSPGVSCTRNADQRDEAWLKREIVPRLDAFTLSEIGRATGLSLAASSCIRAGARVPHPRHWEALLAPIKEADSPTGNLKGRIETAWPNGINIQRQ
jgi:hypothetical protein